jgi:hypothetical protein
MEHNVANTILRQLGGINRLVAMTGAYNFIDRGNGVSFKIKNAKANYIKITLNGKDLYNLEIGRIRGTTYKVVLEQEDLYNDQLKPMIEKTTGMYLSFKEGGHLESDENGEMLKNQVTNILHHANELQKMLDGVKDVEPWVITKAQRSVTDLADITHYLEGESKKMADGSYEEGGVVSESDFDSLKKGDKISITYSSGISRSNKVDLIVKSKTLVGKGKSWESEKITFVNAANPNGVNYYAYKRKGSKVSFAIGDMAIWGVKISNEMADGGYMAKGGMNGKGKWVRNQDDNGWYYYIADAPKVKTPYSISIHEDIDIGDKKVMGYSVQRGGTNEMGYVKNYAIKKFKTLSEAENYAHKWMKEVGNSYAEGGMMAMGGETFEGKVKSIKSSLLSRKKVSPSVQKDYGKTYSPKEAEESAKRIVGAMTARERMKTKMRSKKSK